MWSDDLNLFYHAIALWPYVAMVCIGIAIVIGLLEMATQLLEKAFKKLTERRER